jgi:EAL domain-containing protein (putative c-di-GMP-specific phosphodiesterase class I)
MDLQQPQGTETTDVAVTGPDEPGPVVTAAVPSVRVAESPTDSARQAQAEWEEQIARLLRRPENLRSVYQPIVDLRSGDCVGYEALTRVAEWPARSPQPWFQAASRSGLAAQLEAAALMTALRGRANLPQDRFLTVNVGPTALGHSAVTDVLLDQGDLRGLVVELTDTSALTGEGRHIEVLNGLRERGLFIAVDITDAGLSELDRVFSLKPDLVKLDRGLIKGAHANPVRDRLVRLVVSLAEESGAAVQAEGVEALEDARFLQFVGVRMGQGWLFGRARPGFLPPSSEVTAWLQATWEENITLTRVGRLAVPIGRVGDSGSPGQWRADVDGAGRLLELVSRDGATSIAASNVVRLRASHDLRGAARRVIAAGESRRPFDLIVVTDDNGRFVGLIDHETLLSEALAAPPGSVLPTDAGT